MSLDRTKKENNKKWSTTFKRYVYDIEGEDEPGPRVLLKIDGYKLVEMPASWVEKIE